MPEGHFLRLAALAAIGGGLLRMLAVFVATASVPDANLQQLYFVIDFLLLLGGFGLYEEHGAKLGWTGAAGFAAFVFGILLIRSPQVSFFGAHGYQTGAAVALLGITTTGAMMLVRTIAVLAPLLWFAALAAGLWAATGFLAGPGTALAGLLFGAGFVAAGSTYLRSR